MTDTLIPRLLLSTAFYFWPWTIWPLWEHVTWPILWELGLY